MKVFIVLSHDCDGTGIISVHDTSIGARIEMEKLKSLHQKDDIDRDITYSILRQEVRTLN